MSRHCLLALLLAVTLVLCACGQDTPSDDPAETTAPSVQTDPTEPDRPEPTEPEDTPAQPDPQPYMTVDQALYGASPSGYSFWSVSAGLNTTKRLCIDSEGYIVFELDGSENDVAGVYNNAVLLKAHNDYYILRSVPGGEILFDSSDADAGKIILPEYNGRDMFRDGYLMVMRTTEGENGVTQEIGFLNANGEWLQSLSQDNLILNYFDNTLTAPALEQEVSYLGQGIIGMLCADGVYRYYNMDANTVVKAQFPGNMSKYTLYDALDYNVRFIDGVSDPVYMNNNYYLFYSDGRISAFNVLWPKGLPRAQKCGSGYFDRSTKTARFLYDYGSGILVCDSNGTIIKKQEGYQVLDCSFTTAEQIERSGFGPDGYARVILQNPEGVSCYAVLGIDGEFLFEPMELNEDIGTVFDMDGNYIRLNDTADVGNILVLDLKGTICYQSDEARDFSVKNGILHFSEDGQDYYISIQIPTLY